MQLTNKLGLPEPLVKSALSFTSQPRPGKLSVSELGQPPRIRALKIKHWESLSEDASDRIWALFGSAVHKILEMYGAKTEGVTAEEFIKMTVHGYEIRGVFDLLSGDDVVIDGSTLWDYKVTSVYSVKEEYKKEWVEQLNTYAAMLRELKGLNITSLKIVAMLRDHSKRDAANPPAHWRDYPKHPVKVIDIPVWDQDMALDYLRRRVLMHKRVDESGELPECSEVDRWATPSKWKVYAKGKMQRAISGGVCDTEAGADEVIAMKVEKGDKASDYVKRFVKGESRRCAEYCQVSKFCDQWRSDPAYKPVGLE